MLRRAVEVSIVRALLPPLVGWLVLSAPLERARGQEAAQRNGAAEQQALADALDRALAAGWAKEKLVAAPRADDAQWFRRLSVDLLGTIASSDEVAAFLADARSDKRAQKIDAALADRRCAENLAVIWSNVLVSAAGKDADRTRTWLNPWLADQFHAGTPFSTIARRLIADAGKTREPGAIAFVLSYREAIETLAGVTARAFLGLQIQCAQCHDHPFDHWTRDEFNRFTGFFLDTHADKGLGAGLSTPGFYVVDETPEWELQYRLQRIVAPRHGANSSSAHRAGTPAEMPPTMEGGMQRDGAARSAVEDAALSQLMGICRAAITAKRPITEWSTDPAKFDELKSRLPREVKELVEKYRDRQELFGTAGFLDGTPYVEKIGRTKRAALADWILSSENPWYAKAVVNRIWNHFFGKGLIDPVDDLSGSKDCVHADVLELLAKAFLAHDTDLRFVVGALVRTQAYALSNCTVADRDERTHAERWFAAHPRRPFTAEQLAASLLQLARRPDTEEAVDEDAPSYGEQRDQLVAGLAQYVATGDGGSERTISAGIPQTLFLMNGVFTLTPDHFKRGGALEELEDSKRAPRDRLSTLFLSVLNRPPTLNEAERMLGIVEPGKEGAAAAIEDLFWALVNSTEFHTNH